MSQTRAPKPIACYAGSQAMTDDARQHARHKIEAHADLIGQHAWVGLKLSDISVGGCRVEYALREPVGAKVTMVVSFPNLDTHLSLAGQVVHRSRRHCGIRFELANEDQRWALRNCIRQTLERAS